MIISRDKQRMSSSSAPARCGFAVLIAGASLLALSGPTRAGDGDAAQAANHVLLKKLDAMEQRIKSLEAQLKRKDAPSPASKAAIDVAPNAKSPNAVSGIRGASVAVLDPAPAPAKP